MNKTTGDPINTILENSMSGSDFCSDVDALIDADKAHIGDLEDAKFLAELRFYWKIERRAECKRFNKRKKQRRARCK